MTGQYHKHPAICCPLCGNLLFIADRNEFTSLPLRNSALGLLFKLTQITPHCIDHTQLGISRTHMHNNIQQIKNALKTAKSKWRIGNQYGEGYFAYKEEGPIDG